MGNPLFRNGRFRGLNPKPVALPAGARGQALHACAGRRWRRRRPMVACLSTGRRNLPQSEKLPGPGADTQDAIVFFDRRGDPLSQSAQGSLGTSFIPARTHVSCAIEGRRKHQVSPGAATPQLETAAVSALVQGAAALSSTSWV